MEKLSGFRPKGFGTITPYLTVDGADRFIDFAKRAFDAQELSVFRDDNKRVLHAVLKIGDSFIEISDSTREMPAIPNALHLYVSDVDAVYKKAVKAGATSKMEPKDQFYGDRESYVKDPFGNSWYIATHVKDVSEQELKMHHA